MIPKTWRLRKEFKDIQKLAKDVEDDNRKINQLKLLLWAQINHPDKVDKYLEKTGAKQHELLDIQSRLIKGTEEQLHMASEFEALLEDMQNDLESSQTHVHDKELLDIVISSLDKARRQMNRLKRVYSAEHTIVHKHTLNKEHRKRFLDFFKWERDAYKKIEESRKEAEEKVEPRLKEIEKAIRNKDLRHTADFVMGISVALFLYHSIEGPIREEILTVKKPSQLLLTIVIVATSIVTVSAGIIAAGVTDAAIKSLRHVKKRFKFIRKHMSDAAN